MFTSPPLPSGPQGPKVRLPEVLGALLNSLLVDFLGDRFSTDLLMRFCIDLGSQNGPKMEQKSIKHLTFSSIGVAGGFFPKATA